MRKLTVALRVYPFLSHGADWPSDKLSLVRAGVESMAVAFENVDVQVLVILDGCPPIYEQMIREVLGQHSLSIHKTNGIGNFETFCLQVKLLCDSSSPILYFAEDDYIYSPRAFQEMLNFIDRHGVDFVSPYDHPDYYSLPFHQQRFVATAGDINWKSAASTELTFMAKRESLKEAAPVFLTYRRKNNDASIWFSLTGEAKLLRLLDSFWTAKLLIKMFLHTPGELLFGHRYSLWTPQPSLATHMAKGFVVPLISQPSS